MLTVSPNTIPQILPNKRNAAKSFDTLRRRSTLGLTHCERHPCTPKSTRPSPKPTFEFLGAAYMPLCSAHRNPNQLTTARSQPMSGTPTIKMWMKSSVLLRIRRIPFWIYLVEANSALHLHLFKRLILLSQAHHSPTDYQTQQSHKHPAHYPCPNNINGRKY